MSSSPSPTAGHLEPPTFASSLLGTTNTKSRAPDDPRDPSTSTQEQTSDQFSPDAQPLKTMRGKPRNKVDLKRMLGYMSKVDNDTLKQYPPEIVFAVTMFRHANRKGSEFMDSACNQIRRGVRSTTRKTGWSSLNFFYAIIIFHQPAQTELPPQLPINKDALVKRAATNIFVNRQIMFNPEDHESMCCLRTTSLSKNSHTHRFSMLVALLEKSTESFLTELLNSQIMTSTPPEIVAQHLYETARQYKINACICLEVPLSAQNPERLTRANHRYATCFTRSFFPKLPMLTFHPWQKLFEGSEKDTVAKLDINDFNEESKWSPFLDSIFIQAQPICNDPLCVLKVVVVFKQLKKNERFCLVIKPMAQPQVSHISDSFATSNSLTALTGNRSERRGTLATETLSPSPRCTEQVCYQERFLQVPALETRNARHADVLAAQKSTQARRAGAAPSPAHHKDD